jgi:hypothetical protein
LVEELSARDHSRSSGEERAEGPTAAKTLAHEAAVVLEGGIIDAAQLQDVEAVMSSPTVGEGAQSEPALCPLRKMPQGKLLLGGCSRSAGISTCYSGVERELALSLLRDMLQQRPLPDLGSFFAGIFECEDAMWGLDSNDGLLLYDNDLETIAGTTEFEEFEEEACRALGIDMIEFTELSIQLCSAKGLVKLLLRRRIDSANEVDGDWEGG